MPLQCVIVHDLAAQMMRRERVFRDRQDLLANDDAWLMSRYRLPRGVLLDLCEELRPALERPTRRNHAVPVSVQVLATLGFLATGTFQREMADRSGLSQSTLSRVIPAVLGGVIGLTQQHIQFPFTVGEQANSSLKRNVWFPNRCY